MNGNENMKGLLAPMSWLLLIASCAPQSFSPQDGAEPPIANTSDAALTTILVASGLARPVFVTAPPSDFERLFILEQHTGRIKILNLQS